ncbi:rhomboid family intramembrane serine protease [Sphingobacterium pedocola]|uniref:Peptidase S54 n=1 Tax=Sphingobacterium pedocola TaxID=2082722 RepID=A0ABR9T3J7_9SPHI|nr:rhomboid family intramembrane serine protease [Sphingobacterium pedocola]MBE8719860.1 peptidase S54 [Sphingobacterium pedocola]
MKENVLKSFWRDTYATSSPIPYIITIQVVLFVLTHVVDLLSFSDIVSSNLYDNVVAKLSLPVSFAKFLSQPWSLITHPFIYQGLFNILFDCLWLYWFGNIFLSFLNRRQFLYVFIAGLLLGGIAYLLVGNIPFLANHPENQLNTNALGLAALISATALLLPTYEIRVFIIGNIRLRTIAIIYLGLQFGFYVISNQPAAIAYLGMVLFGLAFMRELRKGHDWSSFFHKKFARRTLKIVHKNENAKNTPSHKKSYSEIPNQETIDQILDKISMNGYESLTSSEKEILFKASKQDQ